jgi:hypothetical protein
LQTFDDFRIQRAVIAIDVEIMPLVRCHPCAKCCCTPASSKSRLRTRVIRFSEPLPTIDFTMASVIGVRENHSAYD